jgi:hypothetical protein
MQRKHIDTYAHTHYCYHFMFIDEADAAIRDELKRELILLASVTNRGTCASTEEENYQQLRFQLSSPYPSVLIFLISSKL